MLQPSCEQQRMHLSQLCMSASTSIPLISRARASASPCVEQVQACHDTTVHSGCCVMECLHLLYTGPDSYACSAVQVRCRSGSSWLDSKSCDSCHPGRIPHTVSCCCNLPVGLCVLTTVPPSPTPLPPPPPPPVSPLYSVISWHFLALRLVAQSLCYTEPFAHCQGTLRHCQPGQTRTLSCLGC